MLLCLVGKGKRRGMAREDERNTLRRVSARSVVCEEKLNHMVHEFFSNNMVQHLRRIFHPIERLGPEPMGSIQRTKQVNMSIS